MSNLRNFVSEKRNCPICSKPLNLSFSNKGKSWKIDKEVPQELSFSLPIKNFRFSKKQYLYQPIYYFNVDDNTVTLDFINSIDNSVQEEISISILDMTKDFFNNKKDFSFYKHCLNKHYHATTGYFEIKRNKISREINPQLEFIQLTINNQPVNLYNDFNNQKSSIQIDKFYQTDLPIVHWDETDSIEASVKTLLTFS